MEINLSLSGVALYFGKKIKTLNTTKTQERQKFNLYFLPKKCYEQTKPSKCRQESNCGFKEIKMCRG